ncbi:hypothetical protein [Vibrio sp. 10N.261.55.A7]|uniref:hypothetical protein n=1 Tax=Vibrio sp. 10N.261.55.A7 TaxID=1880851 RepID=UPI000C827AAC|nr:hypothetical protein [Vibrio sp. 10N.261.55.A7]PMJ92844.1 hypothetical protein BCU12_06800 [Vibrio sp. 10N.261.55.A7]
MQIAALPKTNELLESLMEAISSETTLSEFEIAYYKREAEQLANQCETHLVLTLLYTSLRQQKSTLLHAHEALRLNYDNEQAVYGNIIWALSYVGASKSVYDLISSMDLNYCSPLIIENVICASHFFNDFNLSSRAISVLEEKGVDPDDKDILMIRSNLTIKQQYLNIASEVFNVTEDNLKLVSLLAAEVLEDMEGLGKTVSRNSYLTIVPESEHLDVVFEVTGEPEVIFDLNWALTEKLIEHDQISNGMVARFDICDQNKILVDGGPV